MIRIYADFHKARPSPWDPALEAVPLVCLGTLRDLCRLGVRLSEGLVCIVSMDSDEREDIAYQGVARFDRASGRWWVEYDAKTLSYLPREAPPAVGLVCWSCGAVVGDRPAWTPDEKCDSCDALLEAPWAPPR